MTGARETADVSDEKQDAKPHYLGHRQRLRERFLKDFGAALPDYELLELLLFNVVARKDTKALAKALLAHFNGSLGELLAADPHEIRKVKEAGPNVVSFLKAVNAAAVRIAREQVMDRPVLSSWQAVIDYCRAAMAREKREQFRVLFLDKRNSLMADEVQGTGTVDHTPVYTREVVKRALELGATALIMVHNHPSGDPTPSKADIEMTREVVEAAARLGIVLHDHVIIGRRGHTSFRNSGLL